MDHNKLVLGLLLFVWQPCIHTTNEVVVQSIQLDSLSRAIIAGNFLDPAGIQTAFITRFTTSGKQDPTYASARDGFFTIEQVGPQEARGLALVGDQPALAGIAFDTAVSDYFLVKTTASGLPDFSFGTSGVQRTIDGDWSRANAIAFVTGGIPLLITSGDIVADGQPMGGIALYETVSGLVEQQIRVNLGRNTSLQSLAVLDSFPKRLVFAGFNQGFTACQGILTQYIASGPIVLTIDPFFGASGAVLTPLSDQKKYFDVCSNQSGDIFALGTQEGAAIVDHYLSGGVLDTSWGASGTFVVPEALNAQLKAIKCFNNDAILAVGAQTTFGFPQLLALKLLTGGAGLDMSFGQSGVYCLETDDVSFANDVSMDPDGNLYLAGAFGNNFLVLKLMPTGAVDNTYGQNGIISVLETIASPLTILQDIRPSGEGGGIFGSTNVTRTLNTVLGGTNRVALGASGTQFAIAPGSYAVDVIVPAAGVVGHLVQLYDANSAQVVAQGSSQGGVPLGEININTYSILRTIIDIHQDTVFEVRHLTTTPSGFSNSLGVPASIPGVSELYTQVSILELNPLAIPV